MYNDTVKVANKIISDTDLAEIFQRMDDEIKENIQLCKQETIQNEKYEREYQNWTCKNFEGEFKCTFNFYDDTNITVDNYVNFITIFNNRLHEVKDMWIRYHYSYSIQHGTDTKYIHQRINMSIYESKMDIEVSLSSEDKKMDDIYQLIKDKILGAPERYDRIIKKKSAITNKICFALGVIPSLVICTLLVFVPAVREMYALTFVLYPIAVILLGFALGTIVFSAKLSSLYKTIVPEKKYAGYDYKNQKRIYKDDIESYKQASEIIIGKNIDNLKKREEITELEKKYSKFIPIEIVVIIGLSVIMIILGNIIG